jgi:hypothetical protein
MNEKKYLRAVRAVLRGGCADGVKDNEPGYMMYLKNLNSSNEYIRQKVDDYRKVGATRIRKGRSAEGGLS